MTRYHAKSPIVRTAGGGGVTSARFYIASGSQSVPNNSWTNVNWSGTGSRTSWDEIGCTITNGGVTIQTPAGIYMVTMYVHLSAPGCSSGNWYFQGTAAGDMPGGVGVNGYAQVGQATWATWTHLVDIEADTDWPMAVQVKQWTGQTLFILDAEIGIVRLGDTEHSQDADQ